MGLRSVTTRTGVLRPSASTVWGTAAGDAMRKRDAREDMGKRLYCGNLPYAATVDEVREIFSEGGRTVVDVHIVMDRETGRSRGFAFVELSTEDEAADALASVDGRLLNGRPLTVKEARERAPRQGFSGGPRNFRGGWRDPISPQVERVERLDRAAEPHAYLEPEPMPVVEADGYPPLRDEDYRDRGDRGKRGRDRRGGRRRPDYDGW